MQEHSSCKASMEQCNATKTFSVAHLYREEKAMDMHIHNCYELYYSVSGGKQFLIHNKFYTIKPGDLFVINQYESHHLIHIDKEVHERIVLSIHPEFLKSLSTSETDLSYCFTYRENDFQHKLSLTKEQQQRFLYFINKITTSSGYGQDVYDRSMFCQLMLFLNSAYFHNLEIVASTQSKLVYNTQVDNILSYINQNIHEAIRIEDLANHFYLSESYLCRVFKSTTGTTINKYITARRITIAKSLLANGENINSVCEQCGFNDYSNFIRTFTKAVGVSPKKYAKLSIS